jgi:hypothetical protein
MTAAALRQALAFATRGWPVLPCLPGQKIPATAHGYRDATTDLEQINDWFGHHPDWNLAIATGTPGPDVLDVDDHGPAGNGYLAFRRLKDAGLLDGAAAYVRTPSGGLHAYFAGSRQRNGHLSGCARSFKMRMSASFAVRMCGREKAPSAGCRRGRGVRGGVVVVSLP